MGLINIVRPFETQSITPPATPITATPTSDQNIVILCGSASPKTFSGTYRLNMTYYKIKRPREKPQVQS